MWVYKLTNKINGMSYVGSTKDVQRRIYLHANGHRGGDRLIADAIAEFGWSNFEFSILESDIADIEKLNDRERYWIAFYSSNLRTVGYNVQKGGGHKKRQPNPKVMGLLGKRFGRLVVVGESVGEAEHRAWPTRCDCGTERLMNGRILRRGHAVSCGCWRRENNKKNGCRPKSHGMSRTPEHRAWLEAKTRCENKNRPSWKDYGGRGIKVCERWMHSFENFYKDMGPKPSKLHSLDRMDHDKDYELGNCRWSTRTEQNNNRRNNRYVSVDGNDMTIAEAARVCGMQYLELYRSVV